MERSRGVVTTGWVNQDFASGVEAENEGGREKFEGKVFCQNLLLNFQARLEQCSDELGGGTNAVISVVSFLSNVT